MSTDDKPFSEKMVDILNYGSLNLAMGLGYRVGLFDIMDAAGRPCTVDEICRDASLNHRYVKEWLGVMVCGGIVELIQDDDGGSRFSLPRGAWGSAHPSCGEQQFGRLYPGNPLAHGLRHGACLSGVS